MPDIPSFSEFTASLPKLSLDDLTTRIKKSGFEVASTTGGRHNPGSLHPLGKAADVRITGKSPEEISKLMSNMKAAGYHVIDERKRLPNEKVWGGPHVHIDFGGKIRVVDGQVPSFSEFSKDVPSFSEFTKGQSKSKSKSPFTSVSGGMEGSKPSGQVDVGTGAAHTKGRVEAAFERGLQSWGPKTRWVLEAMSSGAASIANKASGADILSPGAAITNYIGKKLTGVSARDDLSQDAKAIHEAIRTVDTKAGGRSWLSQKLQDVTAGTIASGPELALTMLGIPAWMAFGMGGAAEARGKGEDFKSIVTEAAKGAAIGKLWELSPVAKAGLIKSIGQKMATVGLGTLGVEMVSKAKYGSPAVLLLDALRGDKGAQKNLGASAESAVTMGLTAGAGELLSRGRGKSEVKLPEPPDPNAIKTGVAEKAVSPQVEEAARAGAKKAGVETGAVERAVQPEPTSEQPTRPKVAAPVKTDDKFAGQEGVVNAANLPGVRTVLKAQQTAAAIASKKGVWDFMRYTRDVADNKARIFGQTNSRELDIKLRRSLGLPKWGLSTKTQSLAQDALTFVVESNGNPAELQAMRQKIAASTQALPGWKKRSLRAIDFAEQNYGKLAPVAQEYNTLTDAQRTQELSNGVKSYYRPGYVMHAQEIEGEMGWLESGGGTGASGFRHQRTYDTYADSIAAGINPKSLNAVDLLRTRLTNGQSMLNRRAWVDSLRTTVDPKTTLPVVNKVTIDPVTHVAEAPAGYSVESVGPQQVAVQKGYEGVFSALNDPSWWQSHTAGRILNRTNAAGKTVSLALDTFHLGRLAFWESVIKAGGLKTFKIPLPSYSRGITLLDTSLPEMQNMISRGELKASDYPQLVQNKQRLDLLVDHGYNIGNISDALYADMLHKLPIVGEFNKWLFGQFQRGAMTEVGLLEFERLKRARGSIMTDEAIARQVSKDLNTRFGNLGRQGWFSGKTAQDTMRLLFLAPQWNEGLIKSEFGAVKQAGQAVVDVARGKPFYVGPLARSVGVLAVSQFVANQMINLITRGHPTWQNPEEGFGAKISAWIPDKLGGTGGFFIHPFGLAAETSLLLTKGYERAAGVMKTPGSKKEAATEAASALTQDFNDYLRSRASIATRGAWVVASRRDYLGRSIKPENLATQAAKEAFPKPIPAPAIWDAVFGHPYPGEFQSRLLSSFGIRTERAPSGEQRIRTLAREFNQSKGVSKQGEFYESPYMQLTETKSPEAAKELLKSKTKEQVLKYYEQRVDKPLTGSADRERAFLKTLNPEQRGQYFAAKGQRRQDLSEIRKLLATVGK